MAGRVDVNFDERCLEYLTEAVEQWATAHPWPTLRQTATLAADGTRDLIAPDYFRSVVWIADQTNRAAIAAKDFWDREAPNQYLGDTTGGVFNWREQSIEPVYRQPSTLSTVQVRSEVSDTYTVHLTGMGRDTTQSGTAGYEFYQDENLAIVGSGPITSSLSYVRVFSIGRNKRSAYNMLVTDGTNQLGRIAKGRYNAEYRRLELLSIPTAGTLIRMGGILAPAPVVRATDVPHPSISRDYLVAYVAAMVHKSVGQFEQFQLTQRHAEQLLGIRLIQEKTVGDKDYGGIPDPAYWGHEDLRSWP